ncbi:MAG: glycoside hydrolase family 16 protein [Woeseiaceae bacterium]|jgi:beta-glucanase (GH16 family)|nr:glycoside hydrolase family 16 protein [Woeseiaceae bacterium]
MNSVAVVPGRYAVLLLAAIALSACEDSNRIPAGSLLETIPPADTSTTTNLNIDNPTLTIADNDEVSPGDALTLVFSDEFDGTQLDPAVWFFETGDGTEYGIPGWGNDELQWYLPDNAELAEGKLKIHVRRESVNSYNYTSARINTRDRFAFRYGRIEASMKLPPGQGIWPAFWALAQNSPYGEWAATGEIDVVEAVNLKGNGRNRIYGTIHYGGFGRLGQNTFTGETYNPSTDVTEEFHVYAVEWDATEIRWYVDDVLYAMQNDWNSFGPDGPNAFPAPFDQPFYIIFNVAVGGNFPGPPSGETEMPVTMEVDWVRVYSGEP